MKTFKYAIYQITNDRMEFLVRTGFIPFMGLKDDVEELDMKNFTKIYEGEVEAEDAASAKSRLFTIFNCEHPIDYRGRSLSVGDIVSLNNKDFFYCQPVGWKKIKVIS